MLLASISSDDNLSILCAITFKKNREYHFLTHVEGEAWVEVLFYQVCTEKKSSLTPTET